MVQRTIYLTIIVVVVVIIVFNGPSSSTTSPTEACSVEMGGGKGIALTPLYHEF